MITLVATDLNWITEDVTTDPCAHGKIEFRVNDTTYIKPEDGDLNLSATGLFLLRTIENNHTEGDRVVDHNFLFAHCGHAVWPSKEDKSGIVVIGCNQFKDVSVIHKGDSVILKREDGVEETVTNSDWKKAILSFVQQVQDFYNAELPKTPPEDYEREGWELFWKEWNQRRGNVT